MLTFVPLKYLLLNSCKPSIVLSFWSRKALIFSMSASVITASHLPSGQLDVLKRVLVGMWHPHSGESVKASFTNGPQLLVLTTKCSQDLHVFSLSDLFCAETNNMA